MTTIGFLACETTLPGSKTRREDAFEHDNMIAAIGTAFSARGWQLRVIDWEAPLEAFEGLSLVMLGTAWNYQDKAEAFLAKLDDLVAMGMTVCNSPDIVRWNITKTYLRELAERGARTVPTLWRETVTAKGVEEAIEVFESDRIVVKRQVGAGAEGQELIASGSLPPKDWSFGAPAMLQPYLPAIAEKGELSFLFFDGRLSHCVRKLPANGDYRIQSLYGGRELAYEPSPDEAAQASAIIEAFPFDAPLYARIDMLEGDDGKLMVMEAELIEPYLYPEQGPEMGKNLANAIAKRLEE
jgi:glutathione synthase/RimK-type ligase-like ATP-grasp enzyme